MGPETPVCLSDGISVVEQTVDSKGFFFFTWWWVYVTHSGIAPQGHAGACWPTGAALIVALLIANRVLNGLEIELRSIAIYNTEL